METHRKLTTILALDVGERRIGVARAHVDAPFPSPLTTLANPETFIEDIVHLTHNEDAAAVVIGLPRDLKGNETAQTRHVSEFGKKLEAELTIPVYWTDEAVTSVQAEATLKAYGKPYAKEDIDALAATYILEDFVTEHPEVVRG